MFTEGVKTENGKLVLIIKKLGKVHSDLIDEVEELLGVLEREGIDSFSTSVIYRISMLKRMLEEHKEKMT